MVKWKYEKIKKEGRKKENEEEMRVENKKKGVVMLQIFKCNYNWKKKKTFFHMYAIKNKRSK